MRGESAQRTVTLIAFLTGYFPVFFLSELPKSAVFRGTHTEYVLQQYFIFLNSVDESSADHQAGVLFKQLRCIAGDDVLIDDSLTASLRTFEVLEESFSVFRTDGHFDDLAKTVDTKGVVATQHTDGVEVILHSADGAFEVFFHFYIILSVDLKSGSLTLALRPDCSCASFYGLI